MIDLDAVREGIESVRDDLGWSIQQAAIQPILDVVVQCEVLPTREQIAQALHKHEMWDEWDSARCNDNNGYEHSCKERFLERADVVLKLLRGE